MDRRVREIRTHGGMRGEEPRLLSYSTEKKTSPNRPTQTNPVTPVPCLGPPRGEPLRRRLRIGLFSTAFGFPLSALECPSLSSRAEVTCGNRWSGATHDSRMSHNPCFPYSNHSASPRLRASPPPPNPGFSQRHKDTEIRQNEWKPRRRLSVPLCLCEKKT